MLRKWMGSRGGPTSNQSLLLWANIQEVISKRHLDFRTSRWFQLPWEAVPSFLPKETNDIKEAMLSPVTGGSEQAPWSQPA